MDPIRVAIRQPVTVVVGVILTLLAGALALSRLPIQLTPNVENTIITVTTFWEGASPEEVELNIIDPQEERLLGIAGLRSMTSASNQNSGSIRLEFTTGTDKDDALREVSDKLRQVPDYPENVDEPVIDATDAENRDYIAWIVFGTTDPDFDIRILRDFAIDRIEPALERVAGIAEINVLGGREREVQIRLDPTRLAQYRVTPTAFAQAIRDTNQNVSAGQLADGKRDVRLRTVGQYESLLAIEQTVIAHAAGGPVRVGDVAEVVETYKEPTSFVRSRGEPVIAINADREIGSNIIEVMEGLKAEIARLTAPGGLLDAQARSLDLDGTLTLTQVYDQTEYIDDAIGLVQTNIWIGGGLAIVVLILFLRSIRSVGIIALAIPISVIGAVVAMVAMGRSINVVSLAGMAFAIGMVVDNAIVVLENIFRHLEMGKRPLDAAYDGAREVWGAVLASTLTTIVVFIPILLIQEEAGQLFRDIALAICAAVALSLLVSITVIPSAAARLLRQRRGDAVVQTRRGLGHWLGRLIYAVCGSTLARLAVIALLTIVSVVGTIKLMPPIDYLPRGNRNLVFGLIIPPPGYNIEQMTEMARRIETEIRPFWEAGLRRDDPDAYAAAVAGLPSVPTFDWATQQPGAPVVPPSMENYFLVAFDGILFHGGISDDTKRVVDLLPLFTHATRGEVLPGTIAFPFQVPLFQLGGSTGSAIKLELAGPDLDEIVGVASFLYMELATQYGFGAIQPVPSNFSLGSPEIQVRPDLVRLGEIGLTTADVGLAVRASGDGAIVDEYQRGGESIDLKVINRDVVGQTYVNGLADVPVAAPSGRVVPLASLADIRRLTGPEQITRVGRQRAVSFQVTPPEGMALERMIADLEATLQGHRDAGRLPPSIETTLAGSASKLADVRAALLGDGTILGTLGSSLVLALVVVYLLMCVLFQSFVQPIVIMFSVPLATLGGFVALFAVFLWSVTDPYLPMQTLDVLTMLGFILLIGVVVNNAILLVHQTLNFLSGRGETGILADEGPMTPRRAIAEAVRTRVRPIFMSTLTSVGGMLPLVLMPGSGSELYRGLGSVVVGGLIVSTLFTLFLVPLLLSLVLDVTHRDLAQTRPDVARRPVAAPAAGAPVVTASK
ncbi:MAG: efflux RND transporter permease subunit [Phycisphaerales bacterium]|nr:efflux RND transporter permease subunit [Phycisphaerales bacterium]NNM25793.1 efflux RND transporter permease subunit [Phycisphaerales bacterium]